MRQKHAEGAYTTWDALQADMRVMFANAMAFNPPETLYHKQVGGRPARHWHLRNAAHSGGVGRKLAQQHVLCGFRRCQGEV